MLLVLLNVKVAPLEKLLPQQAPQHPLLAPIVLLGLIRVRALLLVSFARLIHIHMWAKALV